MGAERKVQISPTGQVRLSVPKSIIYALSLEKGSFLSYKVGEKLDFLLIPNKEGNLKLQKVGGQFFVTVPRALAEALSMNKGRVVAFSLIKGPIIQIIIK